MALHDQCRLLLKALTGETRSKAAPRLSIKIGYYYYWCSGALINNTSNDRTPYLLTAEHCGEGANAGDMNQWIFYFNYQSATCTGNYGPSSNTVTGCSLKSKDPLTGFDGSDCELIKLNSTPPSTYNVYYSGWNRTNIPADSGVCIHHPNGDIKKISTYLTPDDLLHLMERNSNPLESELVGNREWPFHYAARFLGFPDF